jgi:hypothetical protein
VVRAEAFEPTGEFRNLLRTVAAVAPPAGPGTQVPLPQVAPGRYEGRFALRGPGVYFLEVTQTAEDGAAVARQTAGYALAQPPEQALAAPNRALLERLAADSGGPAVERPQEAWRRDTRHALQPQAVWPYLVGAALVLFVADVAARRLRLSTGDVAAARAALRRGLGRRAHPSLPRRSTTVRQV